MSTRVTVTLRPPHGIELLSGYQGLNHNGDHLSSINEIQKINRSSHEVPFTVPERPPPLPTTAP